jgi:nitrogen fixation protein NifX
MKIAFATEDGLHVNAHFGWAKSIAVYDITPEEFHHTATLSFGGELREDGNEDKLKPKLDALEDCAILYVAAIGGSAAARVVARNIHPVKVAETQEILDILSRLKEVLGGTPPPWLRKALNKSKERVLDLEDEVVHG